MGANLAMRIREVSRTIREQSCEVERTPWGLFVWNDDFPLVSDANMAWVLRWPDESLAEHILRDVVAEFRRRGREQAFVRFGESPHSDLATLLDAPLRGSGFVPRSVGLEMAGLRMPGQGPSSRTHVREVTKEEQGRESCWQLATFSLGEDGVPAEEGQQLITLSRRRYETLGMRFFLAPNQGQPAGYATLFSRNALGYIEDLYTAPEFRNRGVGSNLVLAVLKASAVFGDEYVSLTTASTNEAAQRLYKRLGFDVVGTRREYVRELSAAKIL